MSPRTLAELGVTVAPREGARAGCDVRGGDRDWLRAALTSLGLRTQVEGGGLHVALAGVDTVGRAVRSALAPTAVLFDLDGVLADIARRHRIAEPDDVAAIAGRAAVGVVTTCPNRLAESVLERHGLLDHVGVVVGSDDGPCKPDPYPVRRALEALGSDAAWMLGDNPSDVAAARAAGVVPFAVAPRGIGAASHADRLRAAGAARLVAGVAALRQLLDDAG